MPPRTDVLAARTMLLQGRAFPPYSSGNEKNPQLFKQPIRIPNTPHLHDLAIFNAIETRSHHNRLLTSRRESPKFTLMGASPSPALCYLISISDQMLDGDICVMEGISPGNNVLPKEFGIYLHRVRTLKGGDDLAGKDFFCQLYLSLTVHPPYLLNPACKIRITGSEYITISPAWPTNDYSPTRRFWSKSCLNCNLCQSYRAAYNLDAAKSGVIWVRQPLFLEYLYWN